MKKPNKWTSWYSFKVQENRYPIIGKMKTRLNTGEVRHVLLIVFSNVVSCFGKKITSCISLIEKKVNTI